MAEKKLIWRHCQSIDDCKAVMDLGLPLSWADGKFLAKNFNEEQHLELIKHVALRLSERHKDRLSAEILLETLFIMMTEVCKEYLIIGFIEELLILPNFEEAIRSLIEISLSGDFTDGERLKTLPIAVAVASELGFGIYEYDAKFPGQIERPKSLLDHIATYLLSVSNVDMQSIRLSLVRYFSNIEYGSEHKPYFTKLMGRFGHSVLDSLFQQLFHKKSESLALQFLLENLPCALEAQGDIQTILHETFKHYMLKNPERFSLFMHALGDRLAELDGGRNESEAGQTFFKHLIALFKVSSDLNQKSLGREVLTEVMKFFSGEEERAIIESLKLSTQLKKSFREIAQQQIALACHGKAPLISKVSHFRKFKRGRKPSLSRKNNHTFLEQVTLLGQPVEYSKAS